MSDFRPEFIEQESTELAEATGLSPTRAKVLTLIKLHKSKQEIADYLGITVQTVQNHIQDLREEITYAEELVDMAGPTHYDNDTLYKEFGGALYQFVSGCAYPQDETTNCELKLYRDTSTGSVLLVEREYTEQKGSLVEERKRTEFYDGNDIVQYLFGHRLSSSYQKAVLLVTFVANAGIDPKYTPEKISTDGKKETITYEEVLDEADGRLITLDDVFTAEATHS